MKKLILVLVMVFMLTGCEEIVIEPIVVQEIEIVEIEIPVIVIEREIEIIEIPVIVVETEIVQFETIVEMPIYIDVIGVTSTFYQTGYSDEIIFVMSRGVETYVMEFRFTDTLTTPPTMHFSQIEYQYESVSIYALFLEEVEDYEGIEVVDYYDFVDEVNYLIEDITWEDMEDLFDYLYDYYYSIELEHEDTFVIGTPISGTLTIDNYTDVLLLKFLEDTTVTITVTTSEMVDINLYYTSFIYYEWDDFLTFQPGTSSQIYFFEAGSHLLELENYYDYDSVDYTIIITVND